MQTTDTIEEKNRPTMQYMSEDIIIEILSRLPVKSLLRFRCVCKQWQSLISDSKFRLSTKGRKRALILLMPYNDRNDVRKTCFYSIDHQLAVQELPNPLKYISPGQQFRLTSCDGLLLFNVITRNCLISMYLWNPSTRCCKEVLQLDLYNSFKILVMSFFAFGLCFDELADDYKAVLWISGTRTNGEVTERARPVLVANLRSKEVAMINLPYILDRTGPLLKGRLHWLVKDTSTSGDPSLIVYFDAKTNSFIEFPIPEPAAVYNQGDMDVTNRWERGWGLGVINECLSMFRPGKSGAIDILIMREYGVKESWTTLFSISKENFRNMVTTRPTFSLDPRVDILVTDTVDLRLYNLKDKSLSNSIHLPNDLPDGRKCCVFYPYVESLALVIGHGPTEHSEAEAEPKGQH